MPERSLQPYYAELARLGSEAGLAAGENLYRAKQGGRNRVVASPAAVADKA